MDATIQDYLEFMGWFEKPHPADQEKYWQAITFSMSKPGVVVTEIHPADMGRLNSGAQPNLQTIIDEYYTIRLKR